MNRRQLIQASFTAAALGSGPGWLRRAASQAAGGARSKGRERVLVVLSLRGGNDGLNTVVPFEDDRYFGSRPTLALPRAKLLPIDASNALHPSLKHAARRFGEGGMTVVQGVGYPDPNLSHFRSTDVWEAAAAEGPLPAEGWIGTACTQVLGTSVQALSMLAIGPEALPRSLWTRGRGAGAACALADLESFRVRSAGRRHPRGDGAARDLIIRRLHEGIDAGPELLLKEAHAAARASIAALQDVAELELETRFPRSGLGRDLQLVAHVLAGGLPTRFFHVSQSGYDTHTEQLATHADLLRDLDAALEAFLNEMRAQRRHEDVLVLVVSEFGRRVQESGVGSTAGTDHGAASTVLLFGGGVRPGIVGDAPDLEDLDENGNLVHKIDFRRVYAGVLEDWLGTDAHGVLRGAFPKVEVARA
jgi:uncharacterized protein (DUF1501 family)